MQSYKRSMTKNFQTCGKKHARDSSFFASRPRNPVSGISGFRQYTKSSPSFMTMAVPLSRRRGAQTQHEKWSLSLIRSVLWAALFAMAYIVAPVPEDAAIETLEPADFSEIKKLQLAVSNIHSPSNIIASHTRRELSAHESKSNEDESLHQSSASDDSLLRHPRKSDTHQAVPNNVKRTKHPRINVFYHTFSGPTEENRNLTQRIVSEQMSYIGAASNRSQEYEWILRYRSVGEQSAANPDFMNDKCDEYSNLKCEYQGHAKSGHEETTLNQMRDFCIENPDELVVYLHSKGALHDFDMNTRWRGPLTVAAVHHSCLEALVEDTCNTCGLQFYAAWAPMFPGNMFAAKCSYVQHLLPVEDFGAKLAKVVHTTTTEPQMWKHTIYTRHYQENFVDINGLERYANEQWIGSHPSISAVSDLP